MAKKINKSVKATDKVNKDNKKCDIVLDLTMVPVHEGAYEEVLKESWIRFFCNIEKSAKELTDITEQKKHNCLITILKDIWYSIKHMFKK